MCVGFIEFFILSCMYTDSLKLMVKANVVPEDSGKSANFCLVLGRPARESISLRILTIGTTASGKPHMYVHMYCNVHMTV